MTDRETLAMLRESARDWVAGEHPVQTDHDSARQGTRERWAAMAELGWAGVAVPEEQGGLGMGFSAYGIIAEELGRELLISPMLSSGLLAGLLLGARQEILDQVIAGQVIVGVALDDHSRRPAPLPTASAVDGGWHLKGTRRFVLDGAVADWFIVRADAGLFLVPRSGCVVEPLDTIDGRALAHISIDASLDTAAHLDISPADISHAQDLARIALAAEMLGAATRAFEITVDYLKMREQFGRPIGSFQGLQHRAAQMLVEIELARDCVAHAFEQADLGSPDLSEVAALAKFMAGEALHHVSNEMVQMHGGIGMTAEHVAGRYLKWARVSEALFGDASWLTDCYAVARGY